MGKTTITLHYIITTYITRQTRQYILGYVLYSDSVAGGYQGGYQAGYQNPGYVTRKELVKSGLLLGAGILKGALLTTVINNINNNNNGK